jgi:hypothetical protein
VRGRRQALVDWLLGDRDDDAVPVTVLANPDTVGGTDLVGGERWSVQELLYALWDDVAPIPGAMAASLGLPATASFGATARLLDLQRRQTPLATFAEVVDELLRGTQDLGRHRRILPRT